jgi:DNA-binding NarL/FixJ family response regulator
MSVSVLHFDRSGSEGMGKPVRVMISSALPVIREGLAEAVAREPDMLVVAVVSALREIPVICQELRPDACLIDLMIDEDDLQTVRDIHRACAPATVVVLTSDFAVGEVLESTLGGKIVFISKAASTVSMLQAVREATDASLKP